MVNVFKCRNGFDFQGSTTIESTCSAYGWTNETVECIGGWYYGGVLWGWAMGLDFQGSSINVSTCSADGWTNNTVLEVRILVMYLGWGFGT